MINVDIYRTSQSDAGSIGVMPMRKDGEIIHQFFSMEPPPRHNARGLSCINTGEYELIAFNSPTFGRSVILLNVERRDYVLCHRGCVGGDKLKGYKTNTAGCILMGMRIGTLIYNGIPHPAVLSSRTAERLFLDAIYAESGKSILTIH